MSDSSSPLLHTSDSFPDLHHSQRRRPGRFSCPSLFRFVLPASVIAVFLLFILTASIGHRTPLKQPDVVFPDFSHYKFLRTLPPDRFPTHPDDGRRVIAIGDIHAMNKSLSTLLDHISYDPSSDTLIHLGDLVSKNKKVSSEPILSFMSAHQIFGVRGNNDQKVIEWKAWMNWIISIPGGREWLDDLDSVWSHIDGDMPNTKFDAWRKKSQKEWDPYVPDGWKLQGKHYKAARDLSQDHYDYLVTLPIVLYAPTAHTYFVHAGLLPSDPTLASDDPKQPLSHLPATANPKEDNGVLRGLQEQALLDEIPQNQDPWVLMNMRSLSQGGKVTDKKEGMPWSDLWNVLMEDCSGLSATERQALTALSEYDLKRSCFPSMVLYGHAASRDLDIKRWSVGLDTGCAYDRRLTAVVLDNKTLFPYTYSETLSASGYDSAIPYGDRGVAHIISVNCH